MIATLTGPNSYLLLSEQSKIIEEFIKQNGDFAVEKIDGEESDFDRMAEAVQSLPFLSNKKLVILRNPGANKQFVEKIDEILGVVPEGTNLVIVEPKLDKRQVYFKTLKAKTQLHEFVELDANGLARWLVERASEQGGKISQSDALYLVERVGINQTLLSNELDKLINYSDKINRTNIDMLTEPTPQSTIFELIDAAFASNRKRVIELYKEQRELKVEPQQIIAMLAWQLNVLAVVKAAGDRSADTIAKEAGMSPYVIRKTMNIANKITLNDVKRLVEDALNLDVRLKSESIDADEALKHYLLTMKK